MSFRGPKAHPNRFEKPPRGVGSEPGDRQDWQRISGKMRRKSMPVLSAPGPLVGGDDVTMAVFHELSRAEGPSQQTTKGYLLNNPGRDPKRRQAELPELLKRSTPATGTHHL